jgi:hypothetical protein
MKVGDKVTVTCEYIPGTRIPCQGKKAVVIAYAADGIEVKFEDELNSRLSWHFGESDFGPLDDGYSMQDPEFSLEEIEAGREIMSRMD